ncbi:MAG TPA: chemotaxis protein CheW [Acidimicrobiales bacterium]|jgi:chemotaxis signal transduction protein|nr:chemotaxis protein CheW [Acidimicrobiales bacterium]
MRALLLRVGDDLFAVPMEVAREVVVAPTLSVLPTAPASVAGVFNLRGEIVPVFDTARLAGLAGLASVAYVAVVETGLGPAGLAMSEVGESVELGEPLGATETPGTVASYSLGTRLVVLIDVETLLAPARIAT